MRAVIQRVSAARVSVAGAIVGDIGPGLLVFLGVAPTDTEADVQWLAEKVAKLRIFPDAEGHINRSLLDVAPPPRSADSSSGLSALDAPLSAPSALVVSQFTLFASTKKGNRPSYLRSAKPGAAIPRYEAFLTRLGLELGRPVATGEFGADMQVALVNDGPVTFWLELSH